MPPSRPRALANKDKCKYGHRRDQQDGEDGGPYQRRKLARHVVVVCHGDYSHRQLLANAAMTASRVAAAHARGGRRRSWNQARYLLIFSRCAAGA